MLFDLYVLNYTVVILVCFIVLRNGFHHSMVLLPCVSLKIFNVLRENLDVLNGKFVALNIIFPWVNYPYV